ncbi:MAG TPA: imidazole glycerol phosphate synthase subunit HisH [Acidimicrobiales bacterium]|nr:imidazole glycerol phosphate synthase subunit HisH [Acidimicrobiales bacterium]
MLDYGIGNLRSAQKALARVGADARLVADPAQARGAAGVVLPGVGAFGRCMEALRCSGLDRVALDAVEEGRPFLGICVGAQMLYRRSEEDPGVAGLGVLDGSVRRLPEGEKRPQMQWNLVTARRPSRLLGPAGSQAWMYFVHSFAPEPTEDTVGVCDYGGEVVAAAERGTVWATQFHPEKSGREGLALLARFVAACG